MEIVYKSLLCNLTIPKIKQKCALEKIWSLGIWWTSSLHFLTFLSGWRTKPATDMNQTGSVGIYLSIIHSLKDYLKYKHEYVFA